MSNDARAQFFSLLEAAVEDGSLVKLTLGKCRSADASLKNLFVRPVTLKTGPHLTFLWRHATQDITKNHLPAEALTALHSLVGPKFLDAHLFTTSGSAQLECQDGGGARLRQKRGAELPASQSGPSSHDRIKFRPIAPDTAWLQALGVTNDRGQPREGMADKFRQIQKFAELLNHLLKESGLLSNEPPAAGIPDGSIEHATGLADAHATNRAVSPLHVIDMGSGKGYLTFAVASLLGDRASVLGVEARKELVEFCNRVATQADLVPRLRFTTGTIAEMVAGPIDVMIALHACDTATDDALAKGIAAGAQLLVVSPCCQKELRAQLTAPKVLADALQHGIFQERQAEFVTDALRAQLLEYAGYRTRVFEFISTEHTARNLMIAAIKVRPAVDPSRATRIRAFAAFYGIRHQQLAKHLGLDLLEPDGSQ